MNTTSLLNNVLPVPANQGMRSTSHNPSFLAAGSGKNGAIQRERQIIPQTSPSHNHGRINSETLPKDKPAHNSDFKNVLNRKIKSRKPAVEPARGKLVEPVSQETDVKTPQQNNDSSPVELPVIANESSTTGNLIPDIAIPGDTAPVPNSLPQLADNTSLTEIIAPSTLNTQCPTPDASLSIENQESIVFIQQSSQPDSSQQTPPAQNTSQLITFPDKPNVTPQQKTQNVVSPAPLTRNPTTDNLISNTNLDPKPADTTPTEGQATQADNSTSALAGRLIVNNTPTNNDLQDNTLAESQVTKTANITKENPAPESRPANSNEQNLLNQQSAILPAEANAKAGSNQQLIQPHVSQDKIADPLKKPDNLNTDLQNGNPISQIARDLTTPESNTNVTNTPPAKTALESANNLTSDNHDPAGAIREQISQSVTAAAQQLNRQITIQLNPPELGKVSVKFSQAGSELTGLIEASNTRTRADINQQIPEILRSLEQAGITVKRIDVTLSDLTGRSNHDSQRDNSSQFNWDRPPGHNFNDSPQQHFPSDSFTTPSQYLSTSSQYEPQAASHQSRVYTSSALDILI
jgi:flagellar hook-length control protein FliK